MGTPEDKAKKARKEKMIQVANLEFPKPIKRTLEKGARVARLPFEHPQLRTIPSYSLGTPGECFGTVWGPSREGANRVYVIWDTGSEADENTEFLITETDFYEACPIETVKLELAKFKINQIVYLHKDVNAKLIASTQKPYIGSQYETDMKVLEVILSRLGTHIVYRIYIPRYGETFFSEEELISADERMQLLFKDFKVAIVNEDLSPFFNRGDKVKIYSGTVANCDNTVNVPLTDELSTLLTFEK